MNPRNFKQDLEDSNDPIIRLAWERLLKRKFGIDIEIIWKDTTETQKGLGLDVTIKTRQGRRYSIELKTRYHGVLNDSDYIMEIISHMYNKEEEPKIHLYSKEGWIYTTTAEYIFHATLNKNKDDFLEAIFYSIVPFKTERYKSEFQKYKNLWLSTIYPTGEFQLTLNKLIPKDIIKRDALEFWEWNYGTDY